MHELYIAIRTVCSPNSAVFVAPRPRVPDFADDDGVLELCLPGGASAIALPPLSSTGLDAAAEERERVRRPEQPENGSSRFMAAADEEAKDCEEDADTNIHGAH